MMEARDLEVLARPAVGPSSLKHRLSTPPLLSPLLTLDQSFDVQASVSPERTAVVDESGPCSFAEMSTRVDALAAALLEAGFASGQIGAIRLGRETSAVAAMLAVMKVGGAYLCIDPAAPAARVAELLRNSGAHVLIGDRTGVTGPDLPAACRQIYLDEVASTAAVPVASRAQPDGLAYVIYTSGSTGTPKGSLVEHRNAVNLVEGLHRSILVAHGPGLRVAVVAPFVFDPSVQQIFAALLLGHTIYLVPEDARKNGGLLAEYLLRHEIDICDGTPAHIKLLANAPSKVGASLPVRHFIIGGETLRYADVAAFRRRFSRSSPRITNIYGTAECAVDSCCYTIGDELPTATGNVPIGTPLVNTELHVVDEHLQPVPLGTPGELCIGGLGVGRGYLDDPARTRARFVDNPLGSGRLYRTGDLAVLREDGLLEHRGRIDSQIKVRGHRVEPGEIESQILLWRGGRAARTPAAVQTCQKCLLSTAIPGVLLDGAGVCTTCRDFERRRTDILRYFGQPADFDRLIERSRRTASGQYDCLLLYSGGKDSTYVLYRLVARGLKIMTFTFDNGFISKAALDNIDRITKTLQIEHVTMDHLRMQEVFNESLRSDSTVCTGCFRALTAISTRLAAQRGIQVVITGLSRGQIMDTKLKQFLDTGVTDPAQIEAGLVEHRKMYHARQDAIAGLLQTDVEAETIESLSFVDYFRYDPASASEVMDYLKACDRRWAEPRDTGFCSTNCRINNVGIHVHQTERGYHNYAAPLSWDIRMGAMTREEAQQKLGEDIPREAVRPILRLINYSARARGPIADTAVVKLGEDALAAYVVAAPDCDLEALRDYLRAHLPEYMVPARITRLDAFPLTTNGKLDVQALGQAPSAAAPEAEEPPSSPTEQRLTEIWCKVFEREGIRADDDFLELGGTSLKAAMVVMTVEEAFGTRLPLAAAFDQPTIRTMARLIDALKSGAQAAPKDLVALRSAPGSTSEVIFLHDSSGRVDAVTELSRRLSPGLAVWGIQAADDSGSSPEPVVDMRALAAERLVRARSVHGSGGWQLAGWSFGGMLAYEMAVQLRAANERVDSVVLIDAEPPDPERWQQVQAVWLASMRKAFPQVSVAVSNSLDVAAQCQLMLRRLGRTNRGTQWLRDHLPLEISDALDTGEQTAGSAFLAGAARIASLIGALARYQPGPLDADVWSVAASEGVGNKNVGWRRLVRGILREQMLEGTHRSILAQPTVAILADWLNPAFSLGQQLPICSGAPAIAEG
jgi:amino acid adenylation domain-containing protein